MLYLVFLCNIKRAEFSFTLLFRYTFSLILFRLHEYDSLTRFGEFFAPLNRFKTAFLIYMDGSFVVFKHSKSYSLHTHIIKGYVHGKFLALISVTFTAHSRFSDKDTELTGVSRVIYISEVNAADGFIVFT